VNFSLCDATAADAPAIAALHAANWRSAYSRILDPEFLAGPIDADRMAEWVRRLEEPAPQREIAVARADDGGLAGFVCFEHAADPHWGGFVDNLHTGEAVRGAGAGKALLREAARRIAARDSEAGLWLWVMDDNVPAQGFYAALGGAIVDRSPATFAPMRGAMRLLCHWPRARALACGS
jgi:ribosomal protein S18 acetylase RimI-like enzyme